MRLLITGASGLLGINLALEAAKSHTVYGTTNTLALNPETFTTLQTNLLAPGAVERALEQAQPDWVIHCAALANVDACETDPVLARQLNTELPSKLATHVARGGARMLHVSTDAVFDGQHGDYREEDSPNPLSVYAQTKLNGEIAVSQANSEAIIARVNLFGWSISGSRSLGEFFFNNLSTGKQVNGFTDVFFCPLLANDLAQIMEQMLAKELKGLYHVVSGECFSKYEFGVRLARQFKLDEGLITPTSVTQGDLKAARSPKLTLRNDKLVKALGESIPNIYTGMQRFYTLYQQGYPQMLRALESRE